METVEAQRPSDAILGEKTKNTGFTVYLRTLDRMDYLKTTAGIDSRSQLLRALVDFADNHQSEFAEFLEEGSQLKAG
jgi:hypothetical protein